MLLRKIQGKISQINQRLAAKTWPNKSIVYYTGHTLYEWSPKSLDNCSLD
ncbi:hypothetical protein AA637_11450 [Cyanobacterium sp. HL-69]|nr:hypothetical protein AA637_11450 [Cyanobacterium sp. HL-69]